MITVRPAVHRPIDADEIEHTLLGESLDVIVANAPAGGDVIWRVHLRGAPHRWVAVSRHRDDRFELTQQPTESPELEFVADRTALLFHRVLGGTLEHGELGHRYDSWLAYAGSLSEKRYSWPEHLRRRFRHRFGVRDDQIEMDTVMGGTPIDLALYPVGVSHEPEHAIWAVRVVDRGDRAARREFKKLIVKRRHLRHGVLVAGEELRCYARRRYPDGPCADRISFSDLGLTPDATFGLVGGGPAAPIALRAVPFGLRDLLEAFGAELVGRRYAVLDLETAPGVASADTLAAAGIRIERTNRHGVPFLDYENLWRLRRLPAISTAELLLGDLPPDADPDLVEPGRPLDPGAFLAAVGGRFLYGSRDDVLVTLHVAVDEDAMRLVAFVLWRYLRYHRPAWVTAEPPDLATLAPLRASLGLRYLILPEEGPHDEGDRIAIDLFEGRRIWKGDLGGPPRRVARIAYDTATETWGDVWVEGS